MNILQELYRLQDKEYAAFQAKLTPSVPKENFIGVRNPDTRALTKKWLKEGGYEEFLNELPHKYYEENMVHGFILSEIRDYDTCIEYVERFLPYVDNWAVNDCMSPKCFKKNKDHLIEKIRIWAASEDTYTCRFGVKTLMNFYLDEDFKPEYLDIPAAIRSDEYYINMMTAWFFATALAKQWDATFPYIENQRLDKWTHNKAIQKARESFRITTAQKQLLNTYKIK